LGVGAADARLGDVGAGLAAVPQEAADPGGDDAEQLGDLRAGAAALVVGTDDPLPEVLRTSSQARLDAHRSKRVRIALTASAGELSQAPQGGADGRCVGQGVLGVHGCRRDRGLAGSPRPGSGGTGHRPARPGRTGQVSRTTYTQLDAWKKGVDSGSADFADARGCLLRSALAGEGNMPEQPQPIPPARPQMLRYHHLAEPSGWSDFESLRLGYWVSPAWWRRRRGRGRTR
jgi:hypothetical protein